MATHCYPNWPEVSVPGSPVCPGTRSFFSPAHVHLFVTLLHRKLFFYLFWNPVRFQSQLCWLAINFLQLLTQDDCWIVWININDERGQTSVTTGLLNKFRKYTECVMRNWIYAHVCMSSLYFHTALQSNYDKHYF